MKYETVFEKCKKIFPYITWGAIERKNLGKECLTFGYTKPLNFLGENILKFESCVDAIWKHKDSPAYYLVRKDIENFVIKILWEIRDTSEIITKNNMNLRNQWDDLLNKPIQDYKVVFPIYGLVISKATQLGMFSAYNSSDYRKFIAEHVNIAAEQIANLSLVKDDLNYLVLFPVKAKDIQRAIELAKPHFKLFEYVAKFWIYDNDNFDIGIFNYNEWRSENGYAFKAPASETDESFASSLKSKGAFQKINVEDLTSPSLVLLWEIVSKYINGCTTELENRLINAIRWIGIANSNDSEVTKYVQYVFALESLLAYNPKNEFITPSISAQLAEYAAFIVGEKANESTISKQELRKKIFKDVKKMYANRSKIVHGNDSSMDKSVISDARELIYVIINSVMCNKKILQMSSMTELSQWIEDLKFRI